MKELRDLYTENQTKKDIAFFAQRIWKDTDKWEYILCSWIWRLNITKNVHTTQTDL